MKAVIRTLFAISSFAAAHFALAGDPPPLPGGLGGLPSGLPSLPSGLGGSESKGFGEEEEQISWLSELNGFAEVRLGYRAGGATGYSEESLAEARVQIRTEKALGAALLDVSFDLLADGAVSDHGYDWETGRGVLDVRSLNLSFSPLDSVDVKLGRQVATWGVGDLVFINDLFPKDWNSFFLGRDVEYLKAPQDSVRLAFYNDIANVELLYSPRFESDRYIDGDRLAYWDTMSGGLTEESSPFAVQSPGDAFSADELHLRAQRMLGRYELAAYGYNGYWKSPAGMDYMTGESIFPELNVFGASVRGPLGKGLVSSEFGFYDSAEDPTGSDPFVRNDEFRFLLGYEQEIGNELTGSVQYYVERTRDYAASSAIADRDRDLVTVRLTKRLWQQTLTLSGFAFYSPSQNDHYARLSASWNASDEWRWDVGANLFGGDYSSFFGQFGGNDNIYLSLRRIF
ncbi:hypothetical protein [Pelagicoccus albus]|uniref:Porin n=1 Tax=Pelagicoccus albus TaxID=415222 RepID=A0A7X1B4S6_9BACT|nr:hypothetical protein [Pelagicoccus albus]MBC2605607.1 hypothetical protein [Pelagicoccus albus]